MTNSLTRIPDPASQWFWDGSQWVCGCDPNCPPGQPPVVIQPPVAPPFFPPPITQPPWYPGANGGVSFGVTAPANPIRGAFWWDGLILWIFDGAAWVNTATGATQGGGGSPGTGGGSGAGTVIISSTAPGNPQVGTQWWDGTVLRVWDGVKWNIVGPGATAGPVPTTTHTFRITQPTSVGVPVVWTALPFTGSPIVDPSGAWDPNTYKITPKKGGVYMWIVNLLVSTVAGNYTGFVLTLNDSGSINATTYVALNSVVAAATSGEWITATGVSLMNGTTDFVRLYVYAAAGSVGGGPQPVVDAYLLP